MALYHRATLVPSKEDLISAWLPAQDWGPAAGSELTFAGAFRFDDPAGQVGMETFLVGADGVWFQVPLTYRDAPLDGAEGSFITEMQHSALGTRWVYDGVGDPTYLTSLAASAMTGQGEALGMLVYDGRWVIAPSKIRLTGGGWGIERVPVDGFEPVNGAGPSPVFRSDRFELTVHRRPAPTPRPSMGLSATWNALAAPVLLAEVRNLHQ